MHQASSPALVVELHPGHMLAASSQLDQGSRNPVEVVTWCETDV